MQRWLKKFRELIGKLFCRRQQQKDSSEESEEWINPYILESRNVVEQILKARAMNYRDFRPIVVDTDCPDQCFGEEDDVDQVLDQLTEGLNFLEICTDRPEYFEERKNWLKQEYGLMVRLLPKHGDEKKYGNLVLDFERQGTMYLQEFGLEVPYLSFYKRRWRIVSQESSENSGKEKLDMEVPIGYNMLIVRLDKNSRQDIFGRNP